MKILRNFKTCDTFQRPRARGRVWQAGVSTASPLFVQFYMESYHMVQIWLKSNTKFDQFDVY